MIMQKRFLLSASAVLVALLTGCGGGGSGANTTTAAIAGTSTTEEIVMKAGASLTVPGSLVTNNNLLTSIIWAVSAQSPASQPLLLANDKCTVVAKFDKKIDYKAIDPLSKRTGESDWTCDLGVVAPELISQDTLYTLLLTGVDDLGGTTSSKKILRVQPNPDALPPANSGNAGKDFSVVVGATAPLNCAGPITNSYQWVVQDNAGLPLLLSSHTGRVSSFTAPAVSTPQTVVIGCRTDDGKNKVTTSSVKVTITPAPANTLVAQIAPGLAIKPGDIAALTSTASWVNALGATVPGPVVTYTWSVASGAPAGTMLLSNGAAATQLFVPAGLTKTTLIPVTLTAAAADGKTSTATQTVVVTPIAVPNVTKTLTPGTQVVVSGGVANIAASGGPELFYRWEQISGPTVILAGATTPLVSFIAPTVSTASTVVLRVAIDSNKITPENPGAYLIDAVVGINPAPVVAPAPAPGAVAPVPARPAGA